MSYALMVMGSILLLGYLLWEVIRFVPGYRRLKQTVAQGDLRVRSRFYIQALLFQALMAVLAFVGVGLTIRNLTTVPLEINDTSLGVWLSSQGNGIRHGTIGIIIGILAVTAGSIILRLRGRQLTPSPPVAALISWWRRVAPDFSALIPVTSEERGLFAVVAVTSGICEEIVFRGWLLFALHYFLGVSGILLVVAGGIIFGLAHSYQGPLGVLATALAGAFFCMLYLGTGTLLIPILLHILANLRSVILPVAIPATS